METGIAARLAGGEAGSAASIQELLQLVGSGASLVRLYGARGPFLAQVAAELIRAKLAPAGRPLVLVTAEEEQAAALADDLELFLGEARRLDEDPLHPQRLLHLPMVETLPYADLSPDRRTIMRRMAILFRLAHGLAGDALIVSARAYARRVVPRQGFQALCDLLEQGEEIDRDRTISALARAGYARVAVVEDPGTFSVRGGVIDLFSPLYRFPVRLELLGDEIESIKFFDGSTQRTLRAIDQVYVHPVRETVRTEGADPRAKLLPAADAAHHPSAKTRSLLEQIEAGDDFFGIESLAPAFHARMGTLDEYLPPSPCFLLDDPDAIFAEMHRERVRADEAFHARQAEHRIALPPGDFVLDHEEARKKIDEKQRIEAHAVELWQEAPGAPSLRFQVEHHGELVAELRRMRSEKGEPMLTPLARHVSEDLAAGRRSVFVVTSVAHGTRLESLLKGYGLAPRRVSEIPRTACPEVLWTTGDLSRGFRTESSAYYTEEELFGPRARRRAPQTKGGPTFGDFRELAVGDYIVHVEHGIARYRGLTKLAARGTPIDFLHLEFDGGTLYLPVYRLAQIHRYVGADTTAPPLDKLGGKTWAAKRRKVSTEVKKLAEDLLKIYAQRHALPGHAFPPPDAMFREFEATFPFEETPDQLKAIEDVLVDMEKPQPMDRLVCGDVGYGKTEVALRAALKAVLGGRQVAVLAPTTVLVEQHAVTFGSRLADYPVRVGVLSRFKPRAEQQATLKKLGDGTVDVVIGTHRLLSKDVRFKDLGLIIVDEEQRFGVTHKERLRALRTQVDTLTLTATPIPRTLHLALMGLREISIIATPPADRLAIRTFVARAEDSLIREAIQKELARGGQVFFVHNRVQDIERVAGRVRELVPTAKIAIGHGQMAESELERVMVDFVDGKFDILVCTTIIESGLDIPRANTMVVNHADRFGLAQLYQLRGRIGRSRERAFCYLLVDSPDALTPDAKQRLEVLQRFSELGAGFQIAQHDLEIRGAGELLGARQSGEIAAVGFEAYSRILEEAVAELRGEAITHAADPDLTTDLPGYIPDEYCPDTGQRLDFYKRFSAANDEDEVKAVLEEMADRFGRVPAEVELLGELMLLKGEARKVGALALDLAPDRLALTLPPETPLDAGRVLALCNQKGSRYRLTPDGRLVRTLTASEQADRVGAYRAVLRQVRACAIERA